MTLLNLFRPKKLGACMFAIAIIAVQSGCSVNNKNTNSYSVNPQPPEDTSQIIEMVNSQNADALVYNHVDCKSKAIALTFDDMGDKSTMLDILDKLKQNNAQATFFLPGIRVAEEPDIAQAILQGGHQIGNNTLSSKSGFNNLSLDKMYNELSKTNELISRETGVTPDTFRIFGLNYDQNVLKAASACKLKYAVGYNINLNSAKKIDEIKKYIQNNIESGTIININTKKSEKTELLAMLDYILKFASDNKYKLLTVNSLIAEQQNTNGQYDENILKYAPSKQDAFSYAYTTKKAVALTFDGIGSEAKLNGILNALDKNKIKATFFISGASVAEKPELCKKIKQRGHEIESGAMGKNDLKKLDFNAVCEDLNSADKIFKEQLGVSCKYMRPKYGTYNEAIGKAASSVGYKLVTYSKNPNSGNITSLKQIEDYFSKPITRGEIITLNADTNQFVIDAIAIIAKQVYDTGYGFVTIDDLYKNQYQRLPLEQISGYDAANVNAATPETILNPISDIPVGVYNVALTFDDWGTDRTVTKILDILKKNNIKATFFLRGNGVINNPNLAKTIAEDGHDVANHTFSHVPVTSITAEALQEDIVKCHRVLTYAIQRRPEMFFRPPTFDIDDESVKVIEATGYKKIIMSDVSTHDWDPTKDPNVIINEVMLNAQSGSIITMHLLDNSSVLQVLQPTIDGLKKQGFTFIKLSEKINQ